MQHEIVGSGPLLDARGELSQTGWARQPWRDANVECVRGIAGHFGARFRIKRWDYYGIWTPELFVSATLAQLSYVGLVFFYVVELATGKCVEHGITRLLGRGIHLPRNSDAGDASYDDGRTRALFHLAPGLRRLDASDPGFDGGRGLRIKVDLTCSPQHDSIVVATPMGAGRFYYNRKINGLPARGSVLWGDHIIRVPAEHSLGQLDWGCGVWPYRSHWTWASANGFLEDARVVGLNLGGGFGDLSRATENAIFINGRLHKLGQVGFDFDARDYRRAWRMNDDADRLEIEFQPVTERTARINLGVIRSEVHQVFGAYTGRVVADDGEVIQLRGLPGFAEEHYARW